MCNETELKLEWDWTEHATKNVTEILFKFMSKLRPKNFQKMRQKFDGFCHSNFNWNCDKNENWNRTEIGTLYQNNRIKFKEAENLFFYLYPTSLM